MLAAVNREGKIVQSRTPAASHASMIASQRRRVISRGFSTTTCFPAAAALTAGSRCAPLGVQTQTTSSPGTASIASRSSKTAQPPSASAAILAPLAGLRLQAAMTRAPSISLIARVWNSAIMPQPMIPKPWFAMSR